MQNQHCLIKDKASYILQLENIFMGPKEGHVYRTAAVRYVGTPFNIENLKFSVKPSSFWYWQGEPWAFLA